MKHLSYFISSWIFENRTLEIHLNSQNYFALIAFNHC